MSRPQRLLAALALVVAMLGVPPASAATQNDAGSGGDAGDTFETATPIVPKGAYTGRLDHAAGDRHDVYRFPLEEGQSVNIEIVMSGNSSDPVELIDPNGVVVDTSAAAFGHGVGPSSLLAGDSANRVLWGGPTPVRVAVHNAVIAGDYRLHLRTEHFATTDYSICFVNCEPNVVAGTDFIFGGSLPNTDTRVLLVPPTHGDLGNPLGPTVLDYIDATLRGIRGWTTAMDRFAADYPQYSYLRDITVDIEIFDGVNPVDPAGYDVIIGYVATGPVFRGVAAQAPVGHSDLRRIGLDGYAHYSGRLILLSLFATSPRAGQMLPDFPEVNDLEIVTLHEFGHTFGLGHTRTWHPELGPDLMNSPATFVYGDGSAVGDGGERTEMQCLSSLNLYGMAVLYRWIPSGEWVPTSGSAPLLPGMPYEWYC
jgi:hypothetical protein